MKVAYIAGPYRDSRGAWYVLQNIRRAEAVALEYWRKGYAVICPHKNTALFDGAAPEETWLEGDMELLRRSDLVVVLPNWRGSEGVKLEIKEAEEQGVPIYWCEDELHG